MSTSPPVLLGHMTEKMFAVGGELPTSPPVFRLHVTLEVVNSLSVCFLPQ